MPAPVAPITLTAAGLSPDRADRATFVARSIARDEFIKNTQIPQLQTAIDNVFNNATVAFNSGTTAAADAASSAINASQAAAAATAIQWVSGTTYAVGDARWSPATNISYRRIIAGAGTTDPSADATNWAAIVLPVLAGGTGATTAAAARTALSSAKSGANSDITAMTGLIGPGLLPVGSVIHVAMNTAPTGFLKSNGALISRATYAALFAELVKSATATMTIATPGVVTWTAHGRSANDPIKFTTTGALPTGLVGGTTYYVVGASITTNTFTLSATAGGAAIATSGTQSGVHTAIYAPFGDGDGSTTFAIPDARTFPRGWDDGRGLDVNRVFGSTQTDDFKSHSHTANHVFTTAGASGSAVNVQTGTSQTGTTGGTETRPHNIALLACIKY